MLKAPLEYGINKSEKDTLAPLCASRLPVHLRVLDF